VEATTRPLIVGAGALYAATDAEDPDHVSVRRTLTDWKGNLVVPAFVAMEADYLILTRLGVDPELAYLEDLADNYCVEGLNGPGIAAAMEVCRTYRGLELGLADASIVILADRFSTNDLASFDERHFRQVTPLSGGAFVLHPLDSA
jgi:predicted nucleic acid-binding protein